MLPRRSRNHAWPAPTRGGRISLALSTLIILFLATLTHSTLGFGIALVAMPLLTLTVGIETATPLVAFVVLTTTASIAWTSRRHIEIRVAWRLLLGSVAGIPLGLFILTNAPEPLVKGILGLVILGFGLYSLAHPRLTTIATERWAYLFGFLSGVFGGAYNVNGPPVVLYGALRRWPPERFRATLQGFFLPAGVLVFAGHGLAGLWTFEVVRLYTLALPVILVAIILGTKLNRRIPTERFERALYAILIGLGLLLLLPGPGEGP